MRSPWVRGLLGGAVPVLLVALLMRRPHGWPKPNFAGRLEITLHPRRASYSRMSPVVIDATYRNIGTEPIDLYWFNCPRFQVLTSDGREFQKTDFAVSQEAAENRYYEKANFTAFMGLPDPIKPGEKFTMGWTLNDWSDLTAAGTSDGKVGGNQKLKVHCQEFGVDSSEVEIQISGKCVYDVCD